VKMAGDWIKLEKATPEKPEVAIVARKLGITYGDAFLAITRLLIWADDATADGFVPFLSRSDGDIHGRQSGLCDALASSEVGWLVFTDGGMRFANWDRHNGKCGKARVLERDKKRKQRTPCPANVPIEQGTKAGLEKRREDTNTPLPPKGDVPLGFESFWQKWPNHSRKAAKDKCLSHWRNKNLEAIADKIILGLERAIVSADWTKDGGAFIPAPVVWMNQRRWEPLVDGAYASPSRPPINITNNIADAQIARLQREMAREAGK
jgi:hypothetical protein